MSNKENSFKKIVSHAKQYGFIFPSSEIYDGINAVYDYGHNGVELKNNIREYWWKSMVHLNENIVGLDASILMHPTTWKASGHVDAFNDPLIDNKDSKKRYRADVLVEDYVAKIEEKIDKEILKAHKKFGEDFNKEKFISTSPKIATYQNNSKNILTRLNKSLEKNDLEDVKDLIESLEISCPESGSKNWSKVKQFNLMFSTKFGASSDNAMDVYLRPETAQGIFVNFLNIQKSGRMKLPFGIAQTGKAFRNEIVARQFIFRMKEFEQMEMQFFVKPGTQKKWYSYWKENRLKWHLSLGLDKQNYRFHDHEKLAHYAENYDIVNILFEVEPNDDYEISIYPGAIIDFFDNSNDTIKYGVQSRDIEYYGNIFLQLIRENSESFIIELLDNNFNVVRKENTFNETDLYIFKYLSPGDYYIRYIKDSNNNGRWDTGNYLKKVQPEKVIYFPNKLNLRSNWDLNENFFIKKN